MRDFLLRPARDRRLAWPGARPRSRRRRRGRLRTLEVVTRAEVLSPSGPTRVWVRPPSTRDSYIRRSPPRSRPRAEGKLVSTSPSTRFAMVAAEYAAGVKPVLTVTSRFPPEPHGQTCVAGPGAQAGSPPPWEHFLRPTKLIHHRRPRARQGAGDRGHGAHRRGQGTAIYEWVVENTFRIPRCAACGRGADIRSMLETGTWRQVRGPERLYVGLARAAACPRATSRDPHREVGLGYQSLGPATPTITRAQHCGAEVYLSAFGCGARRSRDVQQGRAGGAPETAPSTKRW